MNWRVVVGVLACAALVASTFMNWAWYPDIEKYFTGWFTEQNYYGKPGKVNTIFAVLGALCFLVNKTWSKRVNLFFAALNMGYAIKSVILFVSSYDGFVPSAQPGLYVMLFASVLYVIMAVLVFGVVPVKRSVA